MIKKIEANGKLIMVQKSKSSRYIIGKHLLLTIAIDYPSKKVYEFLNDLDHNIKLKTIKPNNKFTIKVTKK